MIVFFPPTMQMKIALFSIVMSGTWWSKGSTMTCNRKDIIFFVLLVVKERKNQER